MNLARNNRTQDQVRCGGAGIEAHYVPGGHIAHTIEINSRVAVHLHKFNGSSSWQLEPQQQNPKQRKNVKKVQRNRIKQSRKTKSETVRRLQINRVFGRPLMLVKG